MKNIEIKGKHQKDKINKANNPTDLNILATRDCMQDIPDKFFLIKNQITMIRMLIAMQSFIVRILILTTQMNVIL